MIISAEGLARERFDQWCRQQNLQPNIYAEVKGNEAIDSMVSLGFGVGLVPKIVLSGFAEIAGTFPNAAALPGRTVKTAHHRRSTPPSGCPAALTNFRDHPPVASDSG